MAGYCCWYCSATPQWDKSGNGCGIGAAAPGWPQTYDRIIDLENHNKLSPSVT